MFSTSIIETVIVENLLWLTEKYLIDYTGDMTLSSSLGSPVIIGFIEYVNFF